MRRLLAAAAAALMALALAGCSNADEPVEVTGVAGAPQQGSDGEGSGDEYSDGPCAGWGDWKGEIYRITWTYGEDSSASWVSDERVAGDSELSMDADVQDEGDTCVIYFTGTVSLTNDNGAWEGTFEGTSSFGAGAGDDQHVHDLDFTLTGTGDYADLEYTYNLYGEEFPWDYTGEISRA